MRLGAQLGLLWSMNSSPNREKRMGQTLAGENVWWEVLFYFLAIFLVKNEASHQLHVRMMMEV